jgi:glutamine cyclotransferase
MLNFAQIFIKMNRQKVALILLILLVISGILYMWPSLPFNQKELRFPDIISGPDANTNIVSGQKFSLSLNETKLSSQDSIIISLNNKRLHKISDQYSYELETTGMPLGYHLINVEVYRGSKNKKVELPFIIVSDIQPVPAIHTISKTITRDTNSYTQGFEIADGILYESGGQIGRSLIRKVNPKTGAVIKSVETDKNLFAEGLTVLNDKVYQLTWQNGVCLIYDKDLNLIKKTGFKSTNGQGWGLCNNGKSLIVSDGSNKLSFLNPETLEIEKVISVYAGSKEVVNLNELEFVNGFIYANIFMTDQIAKIEAATGKVISVAVISNLDKGNPTTGDVLNGIAWNAASKNFLITGKSWGKIYEASF